MMFKSVSYPLVVAVCLILTTGWAFSQEDTGGEDGWETGDRLAIGRYQLIEVEDSVLLLDTATGRIWNRARGGQWSYEGNPTREHGVRKDTSRGNNRDDSEHRRESGFPDLPKGSVRLIIHQRETLEIGMLSIHLSDITDGQALLSVAATDGASLLERTSVEQGDEVAFSLDNRRYTIRVEELRNLLTGNDFASLVFTQVQEKDDEPAEPTETSEKRRKRNIPTNSE